MTARNRRVRVRDVGRSLPPEIGHPDRTRPRRTARQTVGVVTGGAADVGEALRAVSCPCDWGHLLGSSPRPVF